MPHQHSGTQGGYIGIMEKKTETTVEGLGFRDSGKESGNYYSIYIYIRVIQGVYWDNGKENGSYYNGVIQGLGLQLEY